MKSFHIFCLPSLAAASLGVILAGAGCAKDQLDGSTVAKKKIPLAPVNAVSPGIGAPGAGSMDTRATGTVATGQGDDPTNDPDTGAVPVSGAGTTPGARASVATPGTGMVPGAYNGGRQ